MGSDDTPSGINVIELIVFEHQLNLKGGRGGVLVLFWGTVAQLSDM